jgi:hypothetical protein
VAHSDVTIGSLRLTARDCGWLADSHSNVCFYMSCTDGSTTDALALKQRLARLAMVLAQARRHAGDAHLPHVDYLARNCKADELVFLAFAMLEGPLCVVDSVASAGTAILYTTPAKRAGMVTFVQNVPEHFVRLDGPDTTVEQLLATATQAGPSLPAAGLAPRPRPAAHAPRAAPPPAAGAEGTPELMLAGVTPPPFVSWTGTGSTFGLMGIITKEASTTVTL